MNVLIAIPVFNEEKYLARVLSQVLTYNPRVLVVDDGSTDATPAILRQMPQIQVLRHPKNAGYGQSEAVWDSLPKLKMAEPCQCPAA